MPTYFFHVSGLSPFHDGVGIELAGDDAAWSQAIGSCGELLRDFDGRMPDGARVRFTVVDETGRSVASLRFSGERKGRRRRAKS